MRERSVDQADLMRRLAEVGLETLEIDEEADSNDSDVTSPYVHVAHFQTLAVNALQEGDFEQAVEIYTLLNKVHVGDIEVRSNLGFCLIATDVVSALPILTEVCSDSESHAPMRLLNLALARLLCGDLDGSQAAADAARELASHHFEGWMWDLEAVRTEGHVVKLTYITSNLQNYLCALEELLHDKVSEQS